MRLLDRFRSRLLHRRRAAGPLKETLETLQQINLNSAAAAARISLRLDSVSTQAQQGSESLAEILSSAEQLRQHFAQVSESVQNTLSASQEMNQLSASSRELSHGTSTTSTQLQTQMDATVQRIERLVKSVESIMSVSETIEGIARKTMLLSFNAAIEAARAGQHGSGFAVVAAEVRSLAQHTEAHTKQIKNILDEIGAELKPAHDSLLASQSLVGQATDGARSMGQSLERIAQLADGTANDMVQVSAALGAQRAGMDNMFSNLKTASTSSSAITRETTTIVEQNYAASQLVETSFKYYASVDLDTQLHQVLSYARQCAAEAEQVFERAIAAGKCTLDDVLSLEYTEIKGPAIQALSRLFDVTRVPPQGFNPPKYSTRYDHAVDLDLQAMSDGFKERESKLVFMTVLDLNLYMSTHHKSLCQAWTGDYDKDQAFNRCKRFFYDKWLTTQGARVGLGPMWDKVPNRASREEFVRAGCDLTERPGSRELFNLKLYVRDTAIVQAVSVPIYIRGQLFGAASAGQMADLKS